MINFEDAYRIVLDRAAPLDSERVPLRAACGRILAADIVSDVDMPAFDKSMVDGYACRREDLRGILRVVETVAAGYAPTKSIGAGECAKIMTGAPVPDGADMVILVEQSETAPGGAVRFRGDVSNDNIARRASDVSHGQRVLERGDSIRPHDIAMLASVGSVMPEVSVRPKVAVISTGDELVEPEVEPGPAQIRNSNAYQLEAQINSMGAQAVLVSHARDTIGSLTAALDGALTSADVVLFSGGVSMGEFDLVPKLLKERGFEIHFDRIRIQPGKPTVFATSSAHSLFGLPGNPVSTYVIFELLAKPFLLAMMGHHYRPVMVRAPLAETFTRKVASRKAWVPVRFDDSGCVARVDYHGSGHIHAYGGADGMIAFPEGALSLEGGTHVEVRILGNKL